MIIIYFVALEFLRIIEFCPELKPRVNIGANKPCQGQNYGHVQSLWRCTWCVNNFMLSFSSIFVIVQTITVK